MYPLLLGALIGFLIGAFFIRHRQQRSYFAATEYWVYIPGTELPEQQTIMHRMLAANPYGKPSDPPLGPREGVIFSDVRLHIALVLRSKNPQAFRLDLFAEDVDTTPEQLESIALAGSLARWPSASSRFPTSDTSRFLSMPPTRLPNWLADLSSSIISPIGSSIRLTFPKCFGRTPLAPMPICTYGCFEANRLGQTIGNPGSTQDRPRRPDQRRNGGRRRCLWSRSWTRRPGKLWKVGTVPEPFQGDL